MDLMDILRKAGFSGSGLQTAYAVAMAESGGNARAFNGNRNTGDESYGLFQINMLGGMGPERRKSFGLSSNDDLYDAVRNAQVAYKMSKGGTNWSPWSTYKNGAYQKYLGQSGASISGAAGGAPTGTTLPGQVPQQGSTTADILGSGVGKDFAPGAKGFDPNRPDFAARPVQQATQPAGQQAIPAGSGSTSVRDQIIAAAMGVLGTPYSWGGGGVNGASGGFGKGKGIVGFDCSSLVMYAFAKAGIKMPRTGRPQLARGERVPISQLRPGDFLGWGDGHHIAIYIGDGKYIHSPTTGKTVSIGTLSSGSSAWGVRLNLPGD